MNSEFRTKNWLPNSNESWILPLRLTYSRSGIETRLQNAVFHLLRTKAPGPWVIHSHQTRQQEPLAYMLKIQVRRELLRKITQRQPSRRRIYSQYFVCSFSPSGNGGFWKVLTPCVANWVCAWPNHGAKTSKMSMRPSGTSWVPSISTCHCSGPSTRQRISLKY